MTSALAISGDAPFADAALAASKGWSFEPAKRGARAIAAKIRFAVRFVPPPEPAPPEPEQAPAAAPIRRTRRPPKRRCRRSWSSVKRSRSNTRSVTPTCTTCPAHSATRIERSKRCPAWCRSPVGCRTFTCAARRPATSATSSTAFRCRTCITLLPAPASYQPAFIDHVDLYPGAYPARYGRFAGAIVAGEMAPPSYRLHGEATHSFDRQRRHDRSPVRVGSRLGHGGRSLLLHRGRVVAARARCVGQLLGLPGARSLRAR